MKNQRKLFDIFVDLFNKLRSDFLKNEIILKYVMFSYPKQRINTTSDFVETSKEIAPYNDKNQLLQSRYNVR